jgi:serine protease Do
VKKTSSKSSTKSTPAKSVSAEWHKTLLLVLVAVSAGFFGGWFGGQQQLAQQSEVVVKREIIEGESNIINTIAQDVSPSVVSINVTKTTVSQDFFGFGREFESRSAGTGFVLSTDGVIVTNRHVVSEGTTAVSVTFSDGQEAEATLIGRTNQSDPLDIAFLKIENPEKYELVVADLGDSEAVRVGDRVVAIGNALGRFQNTVTSGIISGFGRDIEAFDGGGVETLQNLFQTDAAINSGNSGGPLVNSASEVIGINVATASAENISFAIPINDVKPLIDIVLETGRLERPYLGVRYVPLNADIAAELELNREQGAYIPEGTVARPSILADSPAERAGMQEGDIIVSIDGQTLDERNGLVSILGRKRVGSSVEIIVDRGGEEVALQVVLEAAPEQ